MRSPSDRSQCNAQELTRSPGITPRNPIITVMDMAVDADWRVHRLRCRRTGRPGTRQPSLANAPLGSSSMKTSWRNNGTSRSLRGPRVTTCERPETIFPPVAWTLVRSARLCARRRCPITWYDRDRQGVRLRARSAWISGGPDAAMEILGTVAASMVSLAALVLTITMVVVQLAMGQFSPRIVQRILEDKPSQLAIGIFVRYLCPRDTGSP